MIEFSVLGDPHAQQRARATLTKGNNIRMFDPEKSKTYKEWVALSALPHRPDNLLEGPVKVTLDICRRMPKKFSKKKIQEALEGIIRPVSKPDASNYLKGVEDALNGLIWQDDSQIVSLIVRKWYSLKPQIRIKIEPCGLEKPPQLG